MEKNLENLVQACDLIDEFNSVDTGDLPKIVGLVVLTPMGEIIQLVPRRLADDICQSEAERELMGSCTVCSCGSEDIDSIMDEIQKELNEEDEKEE